MKYEYGQICPDSSANFLGIFDLSIAPPLLFYSYIPVLLIVFLSGIFLFFLNKRNSLNRLFFLTTFFFSAWIVNILFQWTAVDIGVVYFAWQMTAILEIPIFIFSFYFIYVFVNKQDLKLSQKILIYLLIIPIIIMLPTSYNIKEFDLYNCEGVVGILWNYIYILELCFIAWTLFSGVRGIIKIKDIVNSRNPTIILIIGGVLFLIVFFLSNFLGEITKTYEINLIGPIGMLIFISVVFFLIVKYKTFNLKIFGSQVLVFALGISVFAMLLIQDVTYIHYVAVGTLIIVVILGWALIRGVYKEILQKEKIEKLAKNLQTANARLQVLDQQKSEFVSLASHQLRGPLTAIKGYISLILEGDYGKISKDVEGALKKIQSSSNDLAVLVGDYLDVSRIELGHMKYNFTSFSLNDLADEVLKEIGPSFEKNGLELKIKMDKIPANVHADRSKIKQVMLNLLDNSIKYTPEGTTTFILDREKDHVTVTVKDTGVGMSAKVMPELFQKFSRAPNASKTNIIGTGLGLYVAKKIIDEHGGKIWAESEGEGKGSSFSFKIKLV